MGKKDNHKQDLRALFEGFYETNEVGELTTYIASNSALPGRRANLELAAAFSEVVESVAEEEADALWTLCAKLVQISADEAPVNTPEEFLPFCGVIGLGSVGAASPTRLAEALAIIKKLANDPRWRMREAVGGALHRLIAAQSEITLAELETWVAEGSLLEVRAVAAGIADPSLSENETLARWALTQHKKIIERVLAEKDRKSDDFRTLRKALGYTLSLVVQALPEDGFAYMSQLAAWQDKDILWIVKENLKKNRLIKHFPQAVKTIKERL
ncbi:MAG TPA: hypothetical protein G4N96_12885 [Chloroflexi bacterium]|nr:MAG: hypothetical protein B6243_05510 [Anaerolineaceae bacterium 4572_5.2]HEY85995.1 hypothetical protein [Chloroflexota bacterium]